MNDWYDSFMEILNNKYPKRSQLTKELMDLLSIEQEAVYRRLRGKIIFPAYEVCKIASAWNISLDEIIGGGSHQVSFKMQVMNYLKPSKEDMDLLRKRVQVLDYVKDCPDAEYIVACNNLSRSFSAGFPNLYKFNIFKWAYEYCNQCNKESNTTFADTVLPENLLKEVADYYQYMKHMSNTTYILDSKIFDYMVCEIRFFHSISLISDEDKKILKTELYALLDYMLEIANKGCFPETGNKVQIYISMLHVNTNYSYFHIGQIEGSRIHAFNMYDVVTYNHELVENFKGWMQKKKRTSILISEADEKSRIEFFRKQREFIDTL